MLIVCGPEPKSVEGYRCRRVGAIGRVTMVPRIARINQQGAHCAGGYGIAAGRGTEVHIGGAAIGCGGVVRRVDLHRPGVLRGLHPIQCDRVHGAERVVESISEEIGEPGVAVPAAGVAGRLADSVTVLVATGL